MLDLALSGLLAIINKIIPDPAQKAAAQLEVLRLAQAGNFRELDAIVELGKQQTAINAVEAQQGTFRGGWRPFVGWVCGAGLAYQFLARPLLPWALQSAGVDVQAMPSLDTKEIMPLVLGMLGLGGLRTIERIKGKV